MGFENENPHLCLDRKKGVGERHFWTDCPPRTDESYLYKSWDEYLKIWNDHFRCENEKQKAH